MNNLIRYYPSLSGSILAIVSVLWATSVALLFSKYHITLPGIAVTDNFALVVILAFSLLSAITQSLIANRSYRFYDTYRQLSLGFVIALLVVSVSLKFMVV